MELRGSYYNTKEQVKALEALREKLPGPNVQADRHTPTRATKFKEHLTETQVQQLIADYQAGSTIYQLAKHFEIDRKRASRILHRHDIRTRRQPLSPNEINQIHELHRQGWTQTAIGQHFNTDRGTIRRHLDRHHETGSTSGTLPDKPSSCEEP